ncbi:glycosyltransferase family 4 protein [uncultured Mucilaginibacter sp.]|uniref:glycosyltransferase family 4 protein n=1 Tax=uncultured Mucilaginibacter sp. TaxID=797541 RepID=UPI0025F2F368|nr:glycosyltransferase family 4 protein [uncultured Mucilaginibacter sp.]
MPKKSILYIFGGEKASGAEIVIERLIDSNAVHIDSHLFISPGDFAHKLIKLNKPYSIHLIDRLRKLNRSNSSSFGFYLKAIGNYFSVSYRVYKYIKRNNIDVVHANTVVPASYLLPLIIILKPFLNVTWIWSDHDLSYYSKVDTLMSKLSVKFYDHTLAVSQAVKLKYVDNPKLTVLHNGLDIEKFTPNQNLRDTFRRSNFFDCDTVVIGIAATIAPRKGQLELIEAFKDIYKSNKNSILILAGGFSDDYPEYCIKVKNAVRQPGIKYIGHISNITEFYNGCDVIISNSNIEGSEPLGTTIYEAMACEKIVLASATGGTPEIIDDCINGFLFEAENKVDLQKKLSYIINNYHQLVQIKLAARSQVINKFNIKNMIKQYNILLAN